MHVHSLHYYPVKALMGHSVDNWRLGTRGFVDDRRWMFIDERSNFMSQRRYPQFVHWRASVEGDTLSIGSVGDNGPLFTVENARPDAEPDQRVTLFEDTFLVNEVRSPEISELTEAMNIPGARLVYLNDRAHRQLDLRYAAEGTSVSLADGFPYLVTNTASLRNFSNRVGQDLRMNRFRPNIVVDTDTPWIEDGWKQLKIGKQTLDLPKACGRCRVITIEPETGEQDLRLLAQLAEFRKKDNKILFGMNATWREREDPMIKVGDPVQAM